jgi:hypothetical protein
MFNCSQMRLNTKVGFPWMAMQLIEHTFGGRDLATLVVDEDHLLTVFSTAPSVNDFPVPGKPPT